MLWISAYNRYTNGIMAKAARAIIIQNDKILLMHRNKEGSQYYTLVGGRVNESETLEQGLIREIKEETGLSLSSSRLVYTEDHAAPYNEQFIYLCEANQHGDVALQDTSEEAFMNKLSVNIHHPQWVDTRSFATIAFRTPQLQQAIVLALKKGFPKDPVRL